MNMGPKNTQMSKSSTIISERTTMTRECMSTMTSYKPQKITLKSRELISYTNSLDLIKINPIIVACTNLVFLLYAF